MTTAIEEQKQKAATTLATMLDYLGLDASVKAEENNSKISLTVLSDEAGRIIGRKGQTLIHLQLLLNRMLQKNDKDFPRIFIDVDGYSQNRPPRRDSDSGRSRPPRRRDDSDSPRREREDRHENDEERQEQLKQQALDAAKEVKRWGESVTLPAMNAHDRRIIHITLEEDNEINTESVDSDKGHLKSVIISSKN